MSPTLARIMSGSSGMDDNPNISKDEMDAIRRRQEALEARVRRVETEVMRLKAEAEAMAEERRLLERRQSRERHDAAD